MSNEFLTVTQELMSSTGVLYHVSYESNNAALSSIGCSVSEIAKRVGDEKYGDVVTSEIDGKFLHMSFGRVGNFKVPLELGELEDVAYRLRNLSSSRKFLAAI